MLDKVTALFKSRRFYAAVSGVVIIIFQDLLGMTPDQAVTVTGLFIAWIVGDSLKKTE